MLARVLECAAQVLAEFLWRGHFVITLGADAGFVATGMLAPDEGEVGDRAAHRAVALTSMGVATAAYLLMLLTR